MLFKVDAGFHHVNAFAFKEPFLEGGVGFADKDFSAGAEDAMPRDSFAARSGGHGAARGPCAAGESHGPSESPIGKNPAARNLFHEFVNGIERHGESTPCENPCDGGRDIVGGYAKRDKR
jgi:hypothetical protein